MLVQLAFCFVWFFFFFFFFESWIFLPSFGGNYSYNLGVLEQEARASSSESKAKGLGVELSKLRKDLIMAMDDANSTKEKAKVLSNDLKAKRQLTLDKDK